MSTTSIRRTLVIFERRAHLPFLNAKNSNTEWTMLTMTVKVNKYGLVSIKVCCKWESKKEWEMERERKREEGMERRKRESGIRIGSWPLLCLVPHLKGLIAQAFVPKGYHESWRHTAGTGRRIVECRSDREWWSCEERSTPYTANQSHDHHMTHLTVSFRGVYSWARFQ